MDELVDKEEAPPKLFDRQNVVPTIFIVFLLLSKSALSDYFENTISRYIFYFFLLLVFLNIQKIYEAIQNRRMGYESIQNRRFDFKSWLKFNLKAFVYLIIGGSIFYNLSNLMVSAAEITPDSVFKWFPLILALGLILYLIGWAVHQLQKNAKF
jgi:hypothetical protein